MKIYIDDIRTPKTKFDKILRSSDEAIEYLLRYGCPCFISFDHDLGGDDTAMIIVKWMVEMDLDMSGDWIPYDFTWNVHSANICGKENIESLLTSYLSSREPSY